MDAFDYLTMCDEAIGRANRFPGRHDEYKGCILTVLNKLRTRILTRGRLSSKDERAFTEIILLIEKWVE